MAITSKDGILKVLTAYNPGGKPVWLIQKCQKHTKDLHFTKQ